MIEAVCVFVVSVNRVAALVGSSGIILIEGARIFHKAAIRLPLLALAIVIAPFNLPDRQGNSHKRPAIETSSGSVGTDVSATNKCQHYEVDHAYQRIAVKGLTNFPLMRELTRCYRSEPVGVDASPSCPYRSLRLEHQ